MFMFLPSDAFDGSINETSASFIENEEQLSWTIICVVLFIFGITLATGQYLWYVKCKYTILVKLNLICIFLYDSCPVITDCTSLLRTEDNCKFRRFHV